MKKSCKKQKEFKMGKIIKKKVTRYFSNKNYVIIHLIVGLIKKT